MLENIVRASTYALSALALTILPLAAQAAEESKSETIGPWEIEATFKGDRFDRCSISRTVDNEIVVSLVRTDSALILMLESPNWKLDRGQEYPVKMTLGGRSFDQKVAAEVNSVSLDVDDAQFERALSSASALNVIAAGATIRVPLDKSNAALDRLKQCVEKNSKAVESNPFVVPARQP